MRDDMYNTYFDTKLCYGYECNCCENNSSPTYVFDYEDTAVLPFRIDDEYCNDLMVITVYDFRHEEVFKSEQFIDEEGKVYLKINKETSAEVFKRGVYYCGIQAVEVFLNDDNEYEYGDGVTTILSPNDCMINVR